MKGLVRFYVVMMCMISCGAIAQVSNFTLTVNKTNETCQGNGTLTMSVSNTVPNSEILYKIYKLPNTASPMSIQASPNIGGLTSGTYKVVAVQAYQSASASKEKQVTIEKKIVPFSFSIGQEQANCATGGALVLTATSGTLSACEIINGPVRRPRQTSNVFSGLPAGLYYVRAYNECGSAKVKAYTLSLVSGGVSIGDTEYVENASMVCDSIEIANTISSTGGALNYPLTVKHVLSPMELSGQNIVIEQVFATGNASSLTVNARVPRFATERYTYDVTVSDNCNSTYRQEGNIVDPNIGLTLSAADAICAQKFLTLNATKFTGSYTVTFLSAPSDFNASQFQPTPQGPFNAPSISFGSANDPIPFGVYQVQITDSCGRTAISTVELEFVRPVPTYTPSNNDCLGGLGTIVVTVPPQKIVTATITSAPAAYRLNHTLPEDVSAFVNTQGTLRISNLPVGEYYIAIADNCGFSYDPKKVTIIDYREKAFNIATLPSCTANFGGVRFRSANSAFTSARIIAAPASFSQRLPYNLASHLNAAGEVYITDLPAGPYVFEGVDGCGFTKEMPITVSGYNASDSPFVYTPNCGTFSVKVTDDSNGLEGAQYSLQKFFPDTNTWGHPQTANAYTDGDILTSATGIMLTNNATRNNLAYSGTFRIVKKFETFGNATTQNTMCISVLGQFNYSEGLAINAVYTMACAGSPRDIVIDYTGTATAFRISQKNGQPFVLDNGNSNIFHNLEPAQYVFELEDACGNILPQWYESVDLPSMGDALAPTDLVECAEAGVSNVNRQFRIRDKDAEILGPLYSSMYTITYYNTEVDAEAGVNPLPDYITNTVNGQQIFARMQHNQVGLCHKVVSFKLYVGESQTASIDTNGIICNEGTTVLSAPEGYDAYIWSNGATTQSIFASEAGTYTVEVRKIYGTSYCSATASADVIMSSTAKITEVELADWTNDHNNITIKTEGKGDYVYSLDGNEFQSSNVFTDLESGIYNVFVKDINGCGVTAQEVVLLNYPKFFTPNGDGQNDKWKIKYSFKEPNFNVAIFDRYGKLITTLSASSDGWDGTLNGVQLPSTDYWFVVNREDGRELRGHFSMLR